MQERVLRAMVGESFSLMTTPHKFQTAAALVIGAVGVIFVWLNREPVEVNFLFGTFSVSRAWLVIGFFAAGLLVGWFSHSLVIHINRSRKVEGAAAQLRSDHDESPGER